jgi:hypothetical protein
MINAYKMVCKKPEEFGRPRYRWDDNIKIYLEGVMCDGVD